MRIWLWLMLLGSSVTQLPICLCVTQHFLSRTRPPGHLLFLWGRHSNTGAKIRPKEMTSIKYKHVIDIYNNSTKNCRVKISFCQNILTYLYFSEEKKKCIWSLLMLLGSSRAQLPIFLSVTQNFLSSTHPPGHLPSLWGAIATQTQRSFRCCRGCCATAGKSDQQPSAVLPLCFSVAQSISISVPSLFLTSLK